MYFKSNSNNTYFQQYSMNRWFFLFLLVLTFKVGAWQPPFLVNVIRRRGWTIVIVTQSAFGLFLKENTKFLFQIILCIKASCVYRKSHGLNTYESQRDLKCSLPTCYWLQETQNMWMNQYEHITTTWKAFKAS